MPARFDYFVIFAEMRTGSNFLETNLNALDGLVCHGEAFNPHFIGYPKSTDILGVSRARRESDPAALIAAIREQDGVLGGFRYFHDHDPRVLDGILDDPRCAKVILTRNPAESYVSWKIAQSTGQWKLTNIKSRKQGLAQFDAEEFDAHVAQLQAFQRLVLRRLQQSGQTAFYLDYEDLRSLEVMNGLASFLGVAERLSALDTSLKVQNPAPLSQKVANFAQMEEALAGIDRFNLTRTPNFEPRRKAAVPTYVACTARGLVYLPIRGGPSQPIEAWMATADGTTPDALLRNMTQKDLRKWKRAHPGHRSFTVLRHPLARAHHVFCTRILSTGPQSFPQIRRSLAAYHGVPVPAEGVSGDWDKTRHREAFAGFLRFLKANLSGQTSVRVDACWASQASLVQGFAAFMLPDMILRERDLARDLPMLFAAVWDGAAPEFAAPVPEHVVPLADIVDAELEMLAREAYVRDFMMFGFEDWAEG